MPAASDLVTRDGLRVFSAPASVVRVPETFFARNPVETQVVLASLSDASDVLRLLLNGGHSAKAGYIAGAFRQTGRAAFGDEIVSAMKSAGYDVRASNPFEIGQVFATPRPAAAPIVGRLQMLWESMRGAVLELLPKAPGLPEDKGAYLRFVEDIYKSDADSGMSMNGMRIIGGFSEVDEAKIETAVSTANIAALIVMVQFYV